MKKYYPILTDLRIMAVWSETDYCYILQERKHFLFWTYWKELKREYGGGSNWERIKNQMIAWYDKIQKKKNDPFK